MKIGSQTLYIDTLSPDLYYLSLSLTLRMKTLFRGWPYGPWHAYEKKKT